jgi:two-component system cell cycle sensor histidine kinase/response regulator CckA
MPQPTMPAVPSILVVDDEVAVRRSAYRCLSEWGFRVLEAETADDALAVLFAARDRPQLVVIDIILPGKDGITLAQQIREEWPAQRILYMSAYPLEVLVGHGFHDLDGGFLVKPFTRDTLLREVEAALSRPAPSRASQPSKARGNVA